MWTEVFRIGIVLLCYFSVWFIIACVKSRNDVADIAWGPGFLVGSAYAMRFSSVSIQAIILISIVAIWAFRLSGYIFLRNLGRQEDFRYRQWRKDWGKLFYLRSFLQVFLLQGFLLWIIGFPLWFCFLSLDKLGLSMDFSLLFPLGIGVWLFGFLFETTADFQMSKFQKVRSSPQSIMNQGLWRYTRHPNYFGECVLWWGIFFICLSGGSPYWTVIGPLTLTFLLLKVSGVPMLEAKYKHNAKFQEYKRNTSSFIPWIPRRSRNKN